MICVLVVSASTAETKEPESIMLGPLPLAVCYVAGENHAGIRPRAGSIIVLHVPTGDVFSLFPIGSGRSLMLAKIIDGHLREGVQS
jgi:hypothetical protein